MFLSQFSRHLKNIVKFLSMTVRRYGTMAWPFTWPLRLRLYRCAQGVKLQSEGTRWAGRGVIFPFPISVTEQLFRIKIHPHPHLPQSIRCAGFHKDIFEKLEEQALKWENIKLKIILHSLLTKILWSIYDYRNSNYWNGLGACIPSREKSSKEVPVLWSLSLKNPNTISGEWSNEIRSLKVLFLLVFNITFSFASYSWGTTYRG